MHHILTPASEVFVAMRVGFFHLQPNLQKHRRKSLRPLESRNRRHLRCLHHQEVSGFQPTKAAVVPHTAQPYQQASHCESFLRRLFRIPFRMPGISLGNLELRTGGVTAIGKLEQIGAAPIARKAPPRNIFSIFSLSSGCSRFSDASRQEKEHAAFMAYRTPVSSRLR